MSARPPGHPPPLSENKFMGLIVDEIRAGFGLVPFVGSGVSASSGILMGQEFDRYLAWVVYRCVAPKSDQQDDHDRLDLRRQGWPHMPKSEAALKKASEWIERHFKDLCRLKYGMNFGAAREGALDFERTEPGHGEYLVSWIQRPLIPKVLRSANTVADDKLRSFWQMIGTDDQRKGWCMQPQDSPTSFEHIVEAALRSLHDWRATLYFLARLRFSRLPAEHLSLGEVDQSVIDKFNIHITRGRRPNLCHNMLCHLAGPARIRTFLTTNFDSLIEDSLRAFRMEYKVIPVGLQDPLPHPDTAHSLNCVIKLHGELTGTRADHSLDDPPSEQDKERFYQIVCGHDPHQPSASTAGFIPSHLVVVGYSGADVRCVQMLKYVLDLNPQTVIFWVCFCQADYDYLQTRIFSEHEYKGRIKAVISNRADLLFYQLYQRLRFSLPAGGFSYQYAPNVPPGSIRWGENDTESAQLSPDERALEICLRFESERANAAKKGEGALLVVDSASGVSEPMSQAFDIFLTGYPADEISKRPRITAVRHALWLEMEDYFDVQHLAHEVMQVIALRLGRFQLDHSSLLASASQSESERFCDWLNSWCSQARILELNWGTSFGDWLLVLYCRNGPGGCVGWGQCYWDGSGAKEDQKLHYELTAFAAQLAKLGFQIIYAPYSSARYYHDREREETLRQFLVTHDDLFDSPSTSGGNCEHKVPDALGIHSKNEETAISKIVSPSQICKLSSTKPRFARIISDITTQWIRGWPLKLTPPDRARYAAIRFLYGCTLFRQSRHFAAFFTDATFPCQHRFNEQAIDNDWERHKHFQSALDRISGTGMFHLKSGSFLWMHRDIRLSLRNLLESLKPEFLELERKGGNVYHEKLIEVRAGDHYAIGDWYSKAYHATGHALALLEALYHFANCSCLAPKAGIMRARVEDGRPTKVEEIEWDLRRLRRRQGLWRIGISRLIKNLKFGRYGIRFWLEEPVARKWFDFRDNNKTGKGAVTPIAGRLLDDLLKAAREIDLEEMEFRRKWAEFRERPVHLEYEPREKRLECSWEKFMPQLCHELLACLHGRENRGTYAEPESRPDPEIGPKVDPAGVQSEGKEVSKCDRGPIVNSENRSFSYDSIARIGNEFRFEPDSVVWLAKLLDEVVKVCGVRDPADSPQKPERMGYLLEGEMITRLVRIVAAICGHSICKWTSPVELGSLMPPKSKHEAVREGLDLLGGHHGKVSVHFLELLCSLTYEWVRRAKLLGHVEPRASPGETQKQWAEASALARLALDLCPYLEAGVIGDEARIKIEATTLYGLALGRLYRFFEAHRRLNEAKALLTKVHGSEDSLPFAIVELRRAEVLLIEARVAGDLSSELEAWEDAVSAASASEPGTRRAAFHCAVRLFEAWGSHNYISSWIDMGSGKEDFDGLIARIKTSVEQREFTPEFWRYFEETLLRLKEQAAAAGLSSHALLQALGIYFRLPESPDGPSWLGDRHPSLLCQRIHLARLDEAQLALENAERMLSGRSHDQLWWSRLHALQLRVFAEHKFICVESRRGTVNRILALRHQHSHQIHVQEIFQRGLAASPRDLYRIVRLLDYFLPALRHAIVADVLQRYEQIAEIALGVQVSKQLRFFLSKMKQSWTHSFVDWFLTESPSPESCLLEKYRSAVRQKYHEAGAIDQRHLQSEGESQGKSVAPMR